MPKQSPVASFEDFLRKYGENAAVDALQHAATVYKLDGAQAEAVYTDNMANDLRRVIQATPRRIVS